MTFIISEKTAAGRILAEIEAETIEDAAKKHKHGARRVTGDHGLSGCFQSYKKFGADTAVTTCGDQFHVH